MARHAARATYGRRARPTASSRVATKSDWESQESGASSSESDLESSSSSSEEEPIIPMRTRSSPIKQAAPRKRASSPVKSTPAPATRTPKRAPLIEVQTAAAALQPPPAAAPNPRRIARTPKKASAPVSSSSLIDSLVALKGKGKARPTQPHPLTTQPSLKPTHPRTPHAHPPPSSSSLAPSSPSPPQRRTPRRPQRSAAGAARKILAAIGSEDTPSPPPKPSAYVGYGTSAQATAAAVAASEAERVKNDMTKGKGKMGGAQSGAALARGKGKGGRNRAKRQEEEQHHDEEEEEEAVEAALIAKMGVALNIAEPRSSSSLSSAPSSPLDTTPPTSLYAPPPLTSGASSTPLDSLLSACAQSTPTPFAALLAQLAASSTAKAKRWSKVGEASFSEVFGLGGRVLKIIPLRPTSVDEQDALAEPERDEEEWPEESSAADVAREVRLMRATQGLRGFVGLVEAHVVSGAYPVCLLKAWDAYDARKEKGSENVRPSCLPQSQLYTVLVLAHGGTDVEGVKLPGWVQAASVFWQVVDALARAEEACGFEHRDLHWGNVLVSLSPTNTTLSKPKSTRPPKQITSPASPLRRRARLSASKQPNNNNKSSTARPSAGTVERLLDAEGTGARATIIDLSLSRAVCAGETLAYAFEDESVFEGEGDEQFDVYRNMRDLIDGAWQAHHPLTNIMWLAYLARKLLRSKNLRRPGAPQRVVSGGSLSGGTTSGTTLSVSGAEVSAYNSLVRAETCARAALACAEAAQREVTSAADLLAWAL